MFDQENASRAHGVRIGIARLVTGFLAGIFLFITFDILEGKTPQLGMDPESWKRVLSGLRTMAFFVPLPLVFGLGALPTIRLGLWVTVAAAVLFYVGWYAPAPVWRGASALVPVGVFSLLSIFIVHEFLQGGRDDNKLIARFATYFDNAWRHGFQAVLALIFLAAFWAIIYLGAAMFDLIGIEAFSDLITTSAFAWIASPSVLALGIHWTDEGSVLTRGARQIGLFLLSWLGILLTLIVTAFLVALPFTGLEPLWDTKRATVLLLNVGALMILLLNAAYQAGDPPTARLVRHVVRFSTAPLIVIVALAFLGLWLRVDQYGFTPARVLASAELAIVGYHALGYVLAALRPFFLDEPWLSFVKPVNIAGAAFTVLILLGLMTPILDPARISVTNQVKRLDTGRVEPDDFDFGFLVDRRAGRYGPIALEKLAERSGDEREERIALLAQNPGEAKQYLRVEQTFNDRKDALRFLDGASAPDSAFLPPDKGFDPIADCVKAKARFDELASLRAERERRAKRLGGNIDDGEDKSKDDGRCLARRIDLNFDGVDDILMMPIPRDVSNYYKHFVAGLLLNADGTVRDRVKSNFSYSKGSKGSVKIYADNSSRSLDFHQEFVPAFTKASVTPARFNDLLVNRHRVRIEPITLRTSQEAATAAIVSLDGSVPPDGIFTTYNKPTWFDDICFDESSTLLSCYGKNMPIFSDPDAPNAYVTTGIYTLRNIVKVRIWAEENGAWHPIGSSELEAHHMAPRIRQIVLSAETRRRIAEEMKAIPALVGELEIAGIRRTFDYEPKVYSLE